MKLIHCYKIAYSKAKDGISKAAVLDRAKKVLSADSYKELIEWANKKNTTEPATDTGCNERGTRSTNIPE